MKRLQDYRKDGLLVFAGILLNIAGRVLAAHFGLPMYCSLTGTLLCAVVSGPAAAAVCAVSGGVFGTLFLSDSILIALVDAITGVAAGMTAKRVRYMERILSAVSTTMFLVAIRTVLIWMTDMVLYGGSTPFFMTEVLLASMASINLSLALKGVFVAAFIAFPDVFFAHVLVFFGIRLRRFVKRKRRARELRRMLGGKVTLGVLALLFLLFPVSPVYAKNDINFVQKLYNGKNGLTGTGTNDVAQTEDGAMWVGTYGGLYRFDGKNFERIDHIESVRSVYSLYVDEQDRLWIGTNGGGATVFRGMDDYETLDIEEGMPSDTVKAITGDAAGNYYFGTAGGLVCATYQDDQITIGKVIKNVGSVSDLEVAGDGTVCVVNTVGEVYVIEEERIREKLLLGEDIHGVGVSCEDDGSIWVGTDGASILHYIPKHEYYKKSKQLNTGELSGIHDIYFDESGMIYLAADTGIGYMDKKHNVSVINAVGFDQSSDHIFRDYQKNLWFTSSRCGLLSLSRSVFSDCFAICNIDPAVVNVTLRYKGLLYAGTDEGLYILDTEKGRSVSNAVTDYLAGERVRSMTEDKEGNLLIAGYEHGLLQTDGSDISFYCDDGSAGGTKMRLIKTLSDGTVAASCYEGVTFFSDHKKTTVLRPGKELGYASILNILELSDGTLLCGTDGDGIVKLRRGKKEQYIKGDLGFPCDVILRIVKDSEGKGFYVLTGSGMCYLDEKDCLREIKTVPYFNNFDVVEWDQHVFLLGGAGIYVADVADDPSRTWKSYTLLDEKAGLPGTVTSNAWNHLDKDGMLYFSGTTGVYALDLNNYNMRVDEYRTEISSVRMNGKIKNYAGNTNRILVPKGTSSLELTLRLNNFTSSDPMIRYHMSGVDTKKITVPASKLETVYYYSMPRGSHDFHIEVLDENGRQLSDHVYHFTKQKEEYETMAFRIYFYSILLGILLLTIVSLVRIGVYRLAKIQQGEHEMVVAKLQQEKAAALERALASEADANKTKSAFLANMSHEIRTPINAIIGMDTMILREADQDEIKKYARDIESASNTLLSLINDILDFSKIESGKLELVPGEYELADMLNDLVNMLEPKAQGKGLKLIVEANPEIPARLYGDDIRIRQVIINILNNAVKYTESGSITLRMDYRRIEDSEILLSTSVTDTGIGIREEDIAKLFSPYERIEEQRNKRIEGTGLGMSITKNLLDLMGSRLDVTSVYGEGSTFSFSIIQPVRSTGVLGDFREKAKTNAAASREREAFHAPDGEILVVDDVEMNRIVAVSLLKRIRIRVDAVESGSKAIERSKEKKYDVIFMDSMMPEMSGEEAMNRIRRECPENKETPIVVLTADAVKGAREEYLSRGFNGYLSKPINGPEMEALIAEYLPEEKLLPVEDQTPSYTKEDDAGESRLSQIGQIDGIDLEEGIKAAGGEELYETVCGNFADTARMRIDMIRGAFETEDIENYTIQVHALKSSARMIGALSLSQKAQDLEAAGRAGDVESIRNGTDEALSEYKRLYEALRGVFGEDQNEDFDDRELLPEEELLGALSDLAELLEAFDFDTAQELMESLNDYRLPDAYQESYEKIRGAMAEVDRDGVLAIIRETGKEK